MAAGAWTVYNEAKKYIGAGSLTFPGAFRISLHTSASNANTATLSQFSELTGEVTEANGYSSSGKALANESWTAGTSAGQYKFDADDPVWTGTGGTIPNIKFAVISQIGASAGAHKLLCRSQLTSSQFTLSSGNTLTIQMASAGILTLA
jgi:hypothetical protein